MTDLDRLPDWDLPATTPMLARTDLKQWAAEFRDVYQVAQALCKTPFVPAGMIGNPEAVTACVMKGRELGLDPFDSLDNMYVIHGRVGVYAEFMRRRIIQAGHTFKVVETSDTRCIVEGIRKDTGEKHRASFTADAARRAGIDLGKYPADKLIARATSRLCRQAFPDVLSGALIVEDLVDGLIPAADDEQQPAATTEPSPAVQRRRATKPARAARTQPKPAEKPTDDDVAELLGDQPEPSRPAPVAAADPGQGAATTRPPTSASDDLPGADDDESAQPAGTQEEQPSLLDEEPEVLMVTKAQLSKLHVLLGKNDLADRETGLAWLAEAVGHPLASSKELTRDEATHVIDTLENEEPADE